jgi:hypothetical protein
MPKMNGPGVVTVARTDQRDVVGRIDEDRFHSRFGVPYK